MSEHDFSGESVEEIASQHPSAGDDAQVEGVEQKGNNEGEEQGEDGESGAGVDYAGSGL